MKGRLLRAGILLFAAVLDCAFFPKPRLQALLALLAQGGPAGGPYPIRVSVSGIGSPSTPLVIANTSDSLSIGADGVYTFQRPGAQGDAYSVSVVTQPSGSGVACSVVGGSGSVGSGPVDGIVVNCSSTNHAVTVNVTGLLGSGLILRNNGADDLAIGNNGVFAFSGLLAANAPYSVTVGSMPSGPSQTCTPSSAAGLMPGSDVVVSISCSTNAYTIQVNVSGLSGSGLALLNNGGDSMSIGGNGVYTFSTSVASGQNYSVTVDVQPSGPAQTCTVTGGSGTVGSGNVTGIVVNCDPNMYSLGVTVSGLAGSGLKLTNGADTLQISGNGAAVFSSTLAQGTAYAIAAASQPTSPTQTCAVTGGSGTMPAANVSGIAVTCTTNAYSIAVNVTGLSSNGLVLRNNGGDDLAIAASGVHTFASSVASGSSYAVTVFSQPGGNTCTVSSGSGTVGSGDVTTISVNCAANTYNVGVTVSGLAGSGLVLQNNGTDDLVISASGSASFATALAGGSAYTVTILTQPTSPSQTCSVTGGSGSIASGNVTGIAITCGFTVGGSVTGFPAGSSSAVSLIEETSGKTISITSGQAAYSFPGTFAAGAVVTASVQTQPAGPSYVCSLQNASVTIAGNVTNLNVICVSGHLEAGGIFTGAPLVFPTGQLTTIAGSYPTIAAGGTDGIGLNARFGDPRGIATDGANIYIADTSRHNIRRLQIATGQVTTLATFSAVEEPYGMTTDGVYLYFGDRVQNKIYKMHLATKAISLIAGGNAGGGVACAGTANTTCKDGTGADAQFSTPRGIVLAGGFLYVSDGDNRRIRKIDLASGQVTTFFGTGSSAVLTSPDGLTAVGSDLYVAEISNNRVQRISSTGVGTILFTRTGVRGLGTDGIYLYASVTGDGGTTGWAELIRYTSLVDNSGTILTLAGGITDGLLDGAAGVSRMTNPSQIVSDGVYLYVVEVDTNTVRRFY